MTATKRIYEFTDAEANKLFGYVQERERTDWYYGNRKHFDQRHTRIRIELLRHSLPPTASGEQGEA
jgi:hypothetical protein